MKEYCHSRVKKMFNDNFRYWDEDSIKMEYCVGQNPNSNSSDSMKLTTCKTHWNDGLLYFFENFQVIS
jgi:hypothetical protein